MRGFLKSPFFIVLLAVLAFLLYSLYYHSRVVSTSTPHPTTLTPIVPTSLGDTGGGPTHG